MNAKFTPEENWKQVMEMVQEVEEAVRKSGIEMEDMVALDVVGWISNLEDLMVGYDPESERWSTRNMELVAEMLYNILR